MLCQELCYNLKAFIYLLDFFLYMATKLFYKDYEFVVLRFDKNRYYGPSNTMFLLLASYCSVSTFVSNMSFVSIHYLLFGIDMYQIAVGALPFEKS